MALSPNLSLTFSHPMVPISSQAVVADQDLPVELTPQPEGEWMWLGTQTLLFQPKGRMPGATRYTVRVPDTVTDVTGTQLESEFVWEFETEPLKLLEVWPNDNARDPGRLDTPIVLGFNQAINAVELAPFLNVLAGGRELEFTVLRPHLHALPDGARRLLEHYPDNRTLVLQPRQPLPAGTTVTVALQTLAPSAEGPLPTTQIQRSSFGTRGEFRLGEVYCSCRPGEPFHVWFNHELDAQSVAADLIQVDPPLPGGVVEAGWGSMTISGQTRANTTYTLTFLPGLRDTFGQTLSKPQTARVHVGEQERFLYSPQVMEVLPPHTGGQFQIISANVPRVRLLGYRVEPADWPQFLAAREFLWESPGAADRLLDREPIIDQTLRLETSAEGLTITMLDLQPWLRDGKGHLALVLVRPALLPWDIENYPVWVQSTELALDAYVDSRQLVTLATDLASGEPLAGVSITLQPQGDVAKTDAAGKAVFALSEPPTLLQEGNRGDGSALWLEARMGDDLALLPQSVWSEWETRWHWSGDERRLQWHLITDRNLYQPGEQVTVRGWLREVEQTPDGDVGFFSPPDRVVRVNWQAYDSRGNELKAGRADLDIEVDGGFTFDFPVPEDANSGRGWIEMYPDPNNGAEGHWAHLEYRIEEFRRPEFEVSVTGPGTDAWLGSEILFETGAGYYGGGPLDGADVTWRIAGSQAEYSPPGWDRYQFGLGRWFPWRHGFEFDGPRRGADDESALLDGSLDVRGRHAVAVLAEADLPVPYAVTASATVQDLSRQTQTGSSRTLMHPASLYVGARTDTYLARIDEAYPVELVVVGIDGSPVAGAEIIVEASLPGLETGFRLPVDTDEVRSCTLVSALEPVFCDLKFASGGQWQISITVRDSLNRPNLTRLERWVYGTGLIMDSNRQENVQLVPDRETYQPGDTARVMVVPPFAPAYGLYVVNRSGIVETRPLAIETDQAMLEIPITDRHYPNLHVQVFLSGAEDGNGMPMMAAGSADLAVPPLARELQVEPNLATDTVEPGSEAALEVLVSDAEGNPVVNAPVTLLVVDEAILALANYSHGNPMDSFYRHRYPSLSEYRLRNYLKSTVDISAMDLAGSGGGMDVAEESESKRFGLDRLMPMAAAAAPEPAMAMAESADMAMMDDSAGADGADMTATVRTDFRPLAVFVADGTTNAEGVFTQAWTMPDTVGRYRVVAIATSGEQHFGKGETSLTASLPLQIRTQWPRFLNFGDRALLPLLVENPASTDQDVTLVLQSDRLSLARATASGLAADGYTLSVPARSRSLVEIPSHAEATGMARLQVSVFNAAHQDHVLEELPVYRPAARQGFATYGVVEDVPVLHTLQVPPDVLPGFGAFSVTTSSTQLQMLVDSCLSLREVRWEDPSSLSSVILANTAMRDVLYAFGVPGLPTPQEADQEIQDDIDALLEYQNQDGGFPWWRKGRPSRVYVSAQAIHALVQAHNEGYRVDSEAMDRGLGYLHNIRQAFEPGVGPETRRLITAYALWIRSLADDVDSARASRLLAEAPWDEHPLEVLGWSMLVLARDPSAADEVADLLRFVLNRVEETSGKASFIQGYRETDGYTVFQSSRRGEGAMLQAVMTVDPESDVIPKIVSGMLGGLNRQGHWGSPIDNLSLLLAMSQYFRQYEADEPDFAAHVWLDETLVASDEYRERSTATHRLDLPMAWLMEQNPERIHTVRDGTGRLYYRLGLQYVPEDIRLDSLDRGFTVLRTFAPIDDEQDVWQDADGVWHVRLGSRVRVETTLVTPGPRTHVRLSVPLPAGLEAINPALAGSQPIEDPNRDASGRSWWYWRWYDHDQLLSERALINSARIYGGVYSYAVIAEATTAGTFQVPPAHAEEIYAPETFGHSAGDIVMVEPLPATEAKDE
ncbi:MAG: Ig-like domain-containing protein [Caldilineaceae bacterium]|nr:Ig-like domain-containing protein [Caldilineaceae bacterium]